MRTIANCCLPCASALILAGCLSTGDLPVRQLPVSLHAPRIIDRDVRELTITSLPAGKYICSGMTVTTEELTRILSARADKYGGNPVAIRAKSTAKFGDVWSMVELVSSNNCFPYFDVRIPKLEWPKLLTFSSDIAVVTNRADILTITCTKEGIHLNSNAISRIELWRTLQRHYQRRRQFNHDTPIRILATKDTPYQDVINVLDECSGVGFSSRVLGLIPK